LFSATKVGQMVADFGCVGLVQFLCVNYFSSNSLTSSQRSSKNKHINPLDINADVPLIIKSAIKQGICNSFSPSLNHGETKADKYPKSTSRVAHGEHIPVEMVDSDKYPKSTSKVAHEEHIPVETVNSDADSNEDEVKTVDSSDTASDAPDPMPHMHIFDLQDLVGCTFLLDEQDDRQCFHAKIVEY